MEMMAVIASSRVLSPRNKSSAIKVVAIWYLTMVDRAISVTSKERSFVVPIGEV
jgi:hypothetical protein